MHFDILQPVGDKTFAVLIPLIFFFLFIEFDFIDMTLAFNDLLRLCLPFIHDIYFALLYIPIVIFGKSFILFFVFLELEVL